MLPEHQSFQNWRFFLHWKKRKNRTESFSQRKICCCSFSTDFRKSLIYQLVLLLVALSNIWSDWLKPAHDRWWQTSEPSSQMVLCNQPSGSSWYSQSQVPIFAATVWLEWMPQVYQNFTLTFCHKSCRNKSRVLENKACDFLVVAQVKSSM